MTVETDTDRLTILADFGEPVKFSPGAVWPNHADSESDVTVIFDAEYVEVIGERTRINSDNPLCVGRTTDLAGAERNSVIRRTSTGKQYKVVSVEPDGTGITLLELEGPR